jgi:hypothetical protein
MTLLLEQRRADVQITEKVAKHIARRFGLKVMTLLLERRGQLQIFLPESNRNGEPRILLDGHGNLASTQFMWDCRQSNVHLVYLIRQFTHCSFRMR